MCYPQGEFLVGDNDVLLGEMRAASHISKPQFEYWKHTQLIIDVAARPAAACSPWKMARGAFPRPFPAFHRRGICGPAGGRQGVSIVAMQQIPSRSPPSVVNK